MTDPFQQLRGELSDSGPEAVLELLASTFCDGQQYHELFEVRKMQVRHRLGLPLFATDDDAGLDEAMRRQLEDGLIESCREIGTRLLSAGKIREGWMYWRPVGDNEAVAQQLAQIEVNDDNIEEVVNVALHEGVDVNHGYGLVLRHYGTCNAITTLETVAHNSGKEQQQGPVSQLVEHVYNELISSVKAHIAKQESAEPSTTTLTELVTSRDWLFGEFSYHIDPSHLSATVRFARVLEDPTRLQLALDMTEYGRRLDSQFQYPGDEPFADVYPSHGLYFQALLGQDVDRALEFFRTRAESLDIREQGTIPVEVYIDLLARLGRLDEATEASISMIPSDVNPVGLAPTLFELSAAAGSYDSLKNHYRQRNDLLGFATALLQEQEAKTACPE